MKKTFATLSLLMLLKLTPGVAQSDRHFSGKLYDDRGQLTFLSLKEDVNIPAANVEGFITQNVLGNPALDLSPVTTERDEAGFTHIRYSVISNNVRLAHKMIVAHLRNGRLVSVNGDLTIVSSPKNTFQLSEQQALASALGKIKAEKYMWQDEAEEAHIRKIENDPAFTYYPKGIKILYERDGQSLCAWQFDIYASKPLYRAHVVVDASTGAVLAEENQICSVNAPGTAVTKYSGTHTIVCDQNAGVYRLRETTRGQGVETFNMNNGTSYSNATDFTNSSATWSTTGWDQGAADAHWGAEKTYDYYLVNHNRNSIDNNGFKLRSYIHYSSNYANAFWDGTRMTYGDGNGSMGMFATLDICGHEITHGLTSKTAGLVYSYESGALNESFSDIFGIAIENFGRPSNWNWKMGEDLNGGGLRNLSNPNQYWQPDTYQGNNWYVGSGDNGGVHTNSGVGNYWFYLLSVGGFGTNDLGNSYSVSGISMSSAAKIAFRALTVYFTPSTNYANARLLTIQAAKDLFGVCSNEVIQTANAWHAVGVGAQYSAVSTGANFYAFNTSQCTVPATINFTNTTANGTSFLWNFGDGTTSTASNVAHTYTAPGNYNVTLKVTGCSGVDSVFRPSYVSINVPSTPTVANVQACLNNTVILNANGNASIFWFDAPSTSTVAGTGSQFITPPLPANVTYYVANTFTTPAAQGGMPSAATGAYLNSNTQYLLFDVYQNSTLNSVVVEAQTAGTRIFQLRNSSNAILSTISVSLVAGINTVNLNFSLTPGVNYRLGLATSSASSLKRSTLNVSYPYNVGNSVKITNSSSGNTTYIYFYDWMVSTEGCSSPKVPVNITVNALPEVSIMAPDNNTVMCAGEMMPLEAWPPGGVPNGQGMIGTNFHSSGLGTGLFQIDYEYTDTNGCSNTARVDLEVLECTGIQNGLTSDAIAVYPNPASESFTVRNQLGGGNVTVSDATGRLVMMVPVTSSEQPVHVQDLAAGVYLVKISGADDRTLKTVRIIKQ